MRQCKHHVAWEGARRIGKPGTAESRASMLGSRPAIRRPNEPARAQDAPLDLVGWLAGRRVIEAGAEAQAALTGFGADRAEAETRFLPAGACRLVTKRDASARP